MTTIRMGRLVIGPRAQYSVSVLRRPRPIACVARNRAFNERSSGNSRHESASVSRSRQRIGMYVYHLILPEQGVPLRYVSVKSAFNSTD